MNYPYTKICTHRSEENFLNTRNAKIRQSNTIHQQIEGKSVTSPVTKPTKLVKHETHHTVQGDARFLITRALFRYEGIKTTEEVRDRARISPRNDKVSTEIEDQIWHSLVSKDVDTDNRSQETKLKLNLSKIQLLPSAKNEYRETRDRWLLTNRTLFYRIPEETLRYEAFDESGEW